MAKKKEEPVGSVIVEEDAIDTFSYRVLRGPLLHNHVRYNEGDVVNLTDAQYAALPSDMVTMGAVQSEGGVTMEAVQSEGGVTMEAVQSEGGDAVLQS